MEREQVIRESGSVDGQAWALCLVGTEVYARGSIRVGSSDPEFVDRRGGTLCTTSVCAGSGEALVRSMLAGTRR